MAGRPPAAPAVQVRARILARRIRTLREERGWTCDRLANEAGVHTRTVVRLESEGAVQPSFFTVAAVAEALNTTLDGLYATTRTSPGLWSAGYEGRTIESFVGVLLDTHVQAVADVRLTPISRKPGFSKTRLSGFLADAGIEYLHLRRLGNPKENRAPFWNGRLDEGRAGFRHVLQSTEANEQLNELAELAQRSRVAVLCFEQDEDRCHRQVVLETLQERVAVPVTPLG